jgi:hypothetical protein
MESREKFYEYVYSRNGEEARFLVHAWNADEAATQARRALDEQGIAAVGRLTARSRPRPVPRLDRRAGKPPHPRKTG